MSRRLCLTGAQAVAAVAVGLGWIVLGPPRLLLEAEAEGKSLFPGLLLAVPLVSLSVVGAIELVKAASDLMYILRSSQR